jgi:pimeloyl-ACP methyl ester carboxylesterase
MDDVRSTTLTVMGLRTRVLEEGESTRGDPVLMIHGVGGWAENWRAVMEPIARTGRRAVTFDLPGFGESERPGRVSRFGPRDPFYPRFVVALLDALGIERAHLVGSSFGGSVAYTAAVTAPERVRSLVFVAGGGVGTEIAVFLRFCTLPFAPAVARIFGRPAMARDVLRSCFFDVRRIPETLYEEAERFGLPSFVEFAAALRSGATLRGVRRDVRDYWIAQATRYAGPALAVWGRQDYVVPVAQVEGVAKVLPQAEAVIIEECGHLPMVERTEEFLNIVLPFLDRAEHGAKIDSSEPGAMDMKAAG